MNNLTIIKEKIGEWVKQHKEDDANAHGTENYCVDGEQFYIYFQKNRLVSQIEIRATVDDNIFVFSYPDNPNESFNMGKLKHLSTIPACRDD